MKDFHFWGSYKFSLHLRFHLFWFLHWKKGEKGGFHPYKLSAPEGNMLPFIFQSSNSKNSRCRLILYENIDFIIQVNEEKWRKNSVNRRNKFLFSQRKKYDITGVHGPRPPRTDSYSVQVVGPQWICNFYEVAFDLSWVYVEIRLY